MRQKKQTLILRSEPIALGRSDSMGHSTWGMTFVCKTRSEFSEAFRKAEEEFDNVDFYHDHYHWFPDREIPGVCSSEKEAHDVIWDRSTSENGDYSFYVRFKQKRTAKMISLEERILKAKASAEDYAKKHSVHNRKSKTLTCDYCKTRVVIASVRGEDCPYCHFSLQRDVERELDRRYDAIHKMERELREEKKKADSGKARCLAKNDAIYYLYSPSLDYHS